jgi:2-polyprenyl-6-methoxyphenol hydroxylase-like FAD-dependent oxidoreductase
VWLGPGQIIVTMNMFDHGDKFNACLVSEEEGGQEGEWHARGDLERVKAKFSHFEPRIKEFLDLARPEDCYIWRFADLPQLERWVSKNGKALIIGDAAHAMIPYATMVSIRVLL